MHLILQNSPGNIQFQEQPAGFGAQKHQDTCYSFLLSVVLLLCPPIPRTHRSSLSSSLAPMAFRATFFSLPICRRRVNTYAPAFPVNVSGPTSIDLAYSTCSGLYQLSCVTPRKCAAPRSPGLPLRLGRSPTLESRVREWPGCFPVDLTKTRVFWEGKPQLWTCLHQIVFRQVCSRFSWIMTYVGGPSLGRCRRPWTGGPELYKKVEHATRNSFSPCLCISC